MILSLSLFSIFIKPAHKPPAKNASAVSGNYLQKFMFDNKTHTVENRIVSLSQPYIRPIVRGKAKAPVEFGAKYDISIDEKGHARLERIDFDPYNESTIFIDAIERYYKRTGHYPKRILVDKIYRTRENLRFCKEKHIELSGPKLGLPVEGRTKASKEERQDERDRIEVERFFSLTRGVMALVLS